MFPHRLFPARLFAPRYFPPDGRLRPPIVLRLPLASADALPVLLELPPMPPLVLAPAPPPTIPLRPADPPALRLEPSTTLTVVLAYPAPLSLPLKG